MNMNLNDIELQLEPPKSTIIFCRTTYTLTANHGFDISTPHPAEAWSPTSQSQSLFFCVLPKEIRDRIYEHVFGTEPRNFHLGDVLITAPPDLTEHERSIRGLDIWLRTSKAICAEAIATLCRTRYFTPHCCGQPISPILNSLVFHENSIRNVALKYPHSDPDQRPFWFLKAHRMLPKVTHPMPSKLFLKAFAPYITEHLDLRLLWDVKTLAAAKPPEFLTWQRKWYGRFRRVEVCLIGQPQQTFKRSCGQPPRPLPNVEMKSLNESAEMVGRRLVEGDTNIPSTLHWEEEKKMRTWMGDRFVSRRVQTLAVSRKV
jgi:hypothetical protein